MIDIITVGSGPYAIAAAPTRKKIYVTNFLDDTVAVIDVVAGLADSATASCCASASASHRSRRPRRRTPDAMFWS